jgi:hypothetical protein
MRLTDKAKDAINGNTRLKNRLALEFNCSVFTIKRWLDEGEVRLTAPSSTKIIKEETGLTDSEILEEDEKEHEATAK